MSALEDALAAALVALLARPEVATALRAAIGQPSAEEWIPVRRAAEQIGAPIRTLRAAAHRGELAIDGPRGCRVILRSELDRWLLASGRRTPAGTMPAIARAAARMARQADVVGRRAKRGRP